MKRGAGRDGSPSRPAEVPVLIFRHRGAMSLPAVQPGGRWADDTSQFLARCVLDERLGQVVWSAMA